MSEECGTCNQAAREIDRLRTELAASSGYLRRAAFVIVRSCTHGPDEMRNAMACTGCIAEALGRAVLHCYDEDITRPDAARG